MSSASSTSLSLDSTGSIQSLPSPPAVAAPQEDKLPRVLDSLLPGLSTPKDYKPDSTTNWSHWNWEREADPTLIYQLLCSRFRSCVDRDPVYQMLPSPARLQYLWALALAAFYLGQVVYRLQLLQRASRSSLGASDSHQGRPSGVKGLRTQKRPPGRLQRSREGPRAVPSPAANLEPVLVELE